MIEQKPKLYHNAHTHTIQIQRESTHDELTVETTKIRRHSYNDDDGNVAKRKKDIKGTNDYFELYK